MRHLALLQLKQVRRRAAGGVRVIPGWAAAAHHVFMPRLSRLCVQREESAHARCQPLKGLKQSFNLRDVLIT